MSEPDCERTLTSTVTGNFGGIGNDLVSVNQTVRVKNTTSVSTYSSNIYTSTEILIAEDEPAAALDRATATAGTSCSSLHELRTVDYSWTVRTSSYALVASNLMVDARYTARVEIERRPAIKNPDGSGYVDSSGDPSEWETTDDDAAEMIDEYTFTATDREQLVPTTGSWTDDNEDGAIDTDEITPSIELPNTLGWEYRIKSVRIELALTSA